MSWVVPAVITAASLAANWFSARRQAKENKKFAEYQNLVNSQMLDKQLEYNTPKNQMLRYQDAGLNPNLVYGQGSPGNQTAPQQSADFRPADWQSIANIAPVLNQSMLTQSQVQANDATIRQKHVLTELNRLQARVLERNPSLNPEVYNAIMSSIKSSAEIKASEATKSGIEAGWMNMEGIGRWQGMKLGEAKLFKELELLEQRFNLGTADQKIKAEVLQSKEFQNALSEIQVKWMKDAEITPQHILEFLRLFLLKLL